MTGNESSTNLSGLRTPPTGVSGRDATPAEKVERTSWVVYVMILVLSMLVWWMARDRVKVSDTLPQSGVVKVELGDDLIGLWRIVPQEEVWIDLEAEGPAREISALQKNLGSVDNRFELYYQVIASDVDVSEEQNRVTLEIAPKQFVLRTYGLVPAEVDVSSAGLSKPHTIVLERYVARPAVLEVKTLPTVKVPGLSYSVAAVARFPLEAFAPYGVIQDQNLRGGQVVLSVLWPDIQSMVEGKAAEENLTAVEILKRGRLVADLELDVPPLLSVRRKDSSVQIRAVSVEFTFSLQHDYVEESGDFPVSVILPNWLARKGAVVVGLQESLHVKMSVLRGERANFNEQNVAARIILDDVTEKEYEGRITETESGYSLKLSPRFISLDIKKDKLTYKFDNQNVTAERYANVEVNIEWRKD